MAEPAPTAKIAQSRIAPRRVSRVLLVEDDRASHFVTATTLRREGHQVDVAETGLQALRMIAAHHYDLIFMDLQLPDIDGFDTARRIRALGQSARPAIVALTASATAADRARCLASGMDDMLAKPVRLADLVAMLARDPWPAERPAAIGAEAEAGAALDLGRLAELWRGLPEPTVARLLKECLADITGRLPALAAAAARGDARRVETEAHGIAGTAGTYGLTTVHALMRRVLEAARTGDLARAVAGLGEADVALASAAAAVHAALETPAVA